VRTPTPLDPNDTWQSQDGRIQVLRQRNLHDGHFWFVVGAKHATVATRPGLLAILGVQP